MAIFTIGAALLVATAQAAHARFPDHSHSSPAHGSTPSSWSGFDQNAHNSLSPLGSMQARHLPPFLTNNPLPAGRPWGTKDVHTNYYEDWPNTGVTRYYDFTITRESCAPDGVNVTCLLVNGQYPGPLIEANWGDSVQIHVTNNIPDEGAAIHWHGILQKYSQPFDGVPGVSHCPIAPGTSYTYTWTANPYGSSWWHAHYSSQYASGIQGPMVIHGPNNVNYDVDLGPIQISDWYHEYYKTLLEALSVPLVDGPQYPFSKNVLINGKNPFDCANADGLECSDAPMAMFNFTAGKTHRLRFINSGADCLLKVSIDGHTMQVFANDYVEIQPYETDVVTLGIGQRTDVLVTAKNSTTGAYWLRAFTAPGCSSNDGQNVGKAAIYYNNANRSALPISSPVADWDSMWCGNDPLNDTVPIMQLAASNPGASVTVNAAGHSNGTHGRWWLNNVTANVDYNDPILLQAKLGNDSFPADWNVYQYASNVPSVRFIVMNRSGNNHPMHFHGHNIQVLASSTVPNTTWDGTIVNPSNPQRRDVQLVIAWGYIVLQWNQDNPGAWPFHCHIAWHLSLGMIIEVLESPDLIPHVVNVPSTVSETCRNWWSYTDHHVVDDIDSGI